MILSILYLGPKEFLPILKGKIKNINWIFYQNIQDIYNNANNIIAILDASMKLEFREELLKKLSSLKVFVTATTGSNHIDENYLKGQKIPLLTLRGEKTFLQNITPAAEHSWLLLLMCARQIRPVFDDIENGIWDRNKHPGTMLNGKTLGIIGCGRIGQWMAKYGNTFGMKCLGYDPLLKKFPDNIHSCNLNELLKKSDFVSLHVNYDENLEKFIGEKEFNLMKKGSVFINTSRGGLTDEEALLEKVKDGHLSAVGLDVLADEPFIEKSKLLKNYQKYKNIIITPHIGGFSPDALLKVFDFCCERIKNNI